MPLPCCCSPWSPVRSRATDPKWNAWLGCWELVVENARDAAGAPKPVTPHVAAIRRSSRPQVCVEPSGDGVTLTTRVANQAAIEQTIVADGADHPITDAECRGTQRAEWSGDGRKLYSRADLSCSADKGNRRVSGFSILGANGTWTEIQAVDVSGQQTVRVRSYRRVSEVAQIGRGLNAGSTAHARRREGSQLRRCHPARSKLRWWRPAPRSICPARICSRFRTPKVPGSVTDLIVALSYPDRFVVERSARADTGRRRPSSTIRSSSGGPSVTRCGGTYGFYSPFYGPYSPYFYSPFYSYLPWYNPRLLRWRRLRRSSAMAMGPEEAAAVGGIQPTGRGRVVDGLGYTRVRPREAEPTPHGSSANRFRPHRPRADRHRRLAEEVAAAVSRVRVSRVADREEATAADARRNRGKIPGCMKD